MVITPVLKSKRCFDVALQYETEINYCFVSKVVLFIVDDKHIITNDRLSVVITPVLKDNFMFPIAFHSKTGINYYLIRDSVVFLVGDKHVLTNDTHWNVRASKRTRLASMNVGYHLVNIYLEIKAIIDFDYRLINPPSLYIYTLINKHIIDVCWRQSLTPVHLLPPWHCRWSVLFRR